MKYEGAADVIFVFGCVKTFTMCSLKCASRRFLLKELEKFPRSPASKSLAMLACLLICVSFAYYGFI